MHGTSKNWIRLSKPIQILSYNEKEGWWEGSTHLGKVAVWLEPDFETKRVYYTCARLIEDNKLGKNIDGILGILFEPPGFPIQSIQDNDDRSYFDVSDILDFQTSKDYIYGVPILFYSMVPPGPAFCIPERMEYLVWEINDDIVSEIQMQQEIIKKEIEDEKEFKREQAQEQKEQAEKEWEEWEKKQEEDNQ